jgi:hypothetical protein
MTRASGAGPQRASVGGLRLDGEDLIILGVLMDTVYQWVVFKTFYPAQAAVIAILLAFVPYIVLRGPIERIAYHWIARPASTER